jgi:hypothetical protein
MIAELNLNTRQTYQPFYDGVAAGWCVPPNTGPNVEFLPPHNVIGNKWYPKIRNMLNDIFGSDACKKAFKGAGLDLEALGKNGFLIGSASLLTDSSISDAQVGLPSDARQAAAKRVGNVYGLTVTLKSGDTRPRMFFTQDAFTAGGLFSSAEGSFRQVLVHELIHAAGAGGKDPGWWGYLGYDDLSYMQKNYDKIEKACGGN